MRHNRDMTEADLQARRARVRAASTRFLMGADAVPVGDQLRSLAGTADPVPDVYGTGGDVAALEAEVAGLLGKPAAVFMPSGTMAQQCAVRVWAERTGRSAVAVHGLSHLVQHEEGALEALHHLRVDQLTSSRRPLAVADLETAPGSYAALCVELPLRDAGYLLPTWDELVALCGLARERGVPVHLDGARLWESQPFYGRTHAEIAAVADTVYVSFYKGLGAIAGAALAGPQDVVDAARHWQHRHGGTLYSMHPFAASARQGLTRLGDFAGFADRARELASALAAVPGMRIHPDPPQVNAFVLYADVDAEALTEAALTAAERTGTWTFGRAAAADVPGWSAVELVVGPATMEWKVDEVVEVMGALVVAARMVPSAVGGDD